IKWRTFSVFDLCLTIPGLSRTIEALIVTRYLILTDFWRVRNRMVPGWALKYLQELQNFRFWFRPKATSS
ncbi:hypothetical protein, partial [Enterocloster lavalensis]|uniref:hypothetical protein n=1 Tax=Enterocloster lavalensis TaxID=460384 RepID=UPI002FD920C2